MDFYPNEIINEGVVKLRIDAVGGELDKIVDRYPRSFLDEMARQLTKEIETSLGIEGLADSTVELVIPFAPNTYLEHISENVTYRRLNLLDSVSAPRDFWVKWTRLAGDITEYNEENILFELGEDVEQKVREREYRFLLATGNEKYHNSMSRKKVTEWREVIRRAAKRGELTKIETDFELAPETLELEERIADLLGKRTAQKTEEKAEVPYIHSDESAFEAAMARMRLVVEESEAEEEEEENAELELEEEVELIEESEPEEEITEDDLPWEEEEENAVSSNKTVDNCFLRSECAETRSDASEACPHEQDDYVSRVGMQNAELELEEEIEEDFELEEIPEEELEEEIEEDFELEEEIEEDFEEEYEEETLTPPEAEEEEIEFVEEIPEVALEIPEIIEEPLRLLRKSRRSRKSRKSLLRNLLPLKFPHP